MFSKCFSRSETWWNSRPRFWNKSYVVVEGECFLCCCLYWSVYNFIVSEHIELACFLSLCRYRAESSIGQRALYKTLLLNRILRKTVRQEQIQCPRHKINTKPNQRVHHRTERACSWIKTYSVLLFCLHISKWKFHRAVFIIRTARANPAFKYSISNWRFSRAAFLNRTEQACLSVEPLEEIQCSNIVFKTQIEPVCHILNKRAVHQSN